MAHWATACASALRHMGSAPLVAVRDTAVASASAPMKRFCAQPGCPALVDRGETRCPTHQHAQERAYDARRGTAAERGYDAAHRNWRAAILARDPICTACGKERATYADHIIPL